MVDHCVVQTSEQAQRIHAALTYEVAIPWHIASLT